MPRSPLAFALASASLALAAGSAAAEAEPKTSPNGLPARQGPKDSLGGIVADQTISVAGHEFYKNFCALWHDKPMNEMFSIAIRERPSARRGNQVVVEYVGRVIFQGVLPPSRAAIGPISQQAVEISYDSVVNSEVQRLLFRNDELAPDEF